MNDVKEGAVIEVPQTFQRRNVPAEVTAPEANPMAMIARAVAQGWEPDRLKQLMDLQERWEANEARKAFVAAMAAFKSDPPAIFKAKKVDIPGGAKFSHATLAQVCDAACAALAVHGLSHKWETAQNGDAITVTCVITHALGHSERTTLTASPDDSGKKNSIQQIASTVTYLERYTLMAACGLAAKDMDDDGRGAGKGNAPEPDAAGKKALEACGTMSALKTAWEALSVDQRKTLAGVKAECKKRIEEAAKQEGAK